MMNPEFCRQRQQRLARILRERDVELVLLIRPEHVQYFTGFRPAAVHQAAVALFPDGRTLLAAPNDVPEKHAADEAVAFEAQWNATLRQDQLQAALQTLVPLFPAKLRRIGIESSVNPVCFPGLGKSGEIEWIDLEPELWTLRRRKDPDELALIETAIACTEAMYQRAREIIIPGLRELDIYNELHTTAVRTAGEPLLAVGNDYQCCSPGGSPRLRKIQQGELYILDLGVCYRGYYSDNCRTICVGQSPDSAQQAAWEAIVAVLQLVESQVRPGISARELYLQAAGQLNGRIPGGFFHHLGHGIGLFPHETPHLNDRWDDRFEEGDVFTAEPGLYAPELRAGIRLEQDYVVTADGVRRLTSHPLELFLPEVQQTAGSR